MPKKPPSREKLPVALPPAYPIGGAEVVPVQLFSSPSRRLKGDDPWYNEFNKLAWIDEDTSLRCIILRQTNGTLSGFVGVEPDHPLFGYNCDAIPASYAIQVHGGVTYAKLCETQRDERISVCHVTVGRRKRQLSPGPHDEGHEDVWWFGFHTSHAYDYAPFGGIPAAPEIGQTYRDQHYVYRECLKLARQLDRLGANRAHNRPYDFDDQIPPLGLEAK